MKLSKLHINQFRHLENLDFDFTYPEDFHNETKRGKPLDKICFIGQSATGKTGLLELIQDKIEPTYNSKPSLSKLVITDNRAAYFNFNETSNEEVRENLL